MLCPVLFRPGILLALVAGGVWITVSAGADSPATVHLLGDFETEGEVEQWRADAPAREDCRLAVVTRSTDHASRGEASLRVLFPRQQPGEPVYVILEPSIDNRGLNLVNWSGWDVLVADIHNPSDSAVRLGNRIRDVNRRGQFGMSLVLQPGWNRVTWRLEHAGPLDLNQVAELSFSMTSPDRDYVLHFDNIHLGRVQAGRAEDLSRRLQQVSATLEETPRRLGDAAAPDLASLRETVDALADGGDARQHSGAAREAFDRLTGVLADEAICVAAGMSLPTQPPVSVVPFRAGEPPVTVDVVDEGAGVRRFAQAVEVRREVMELAQRMAQECPAEDFCIGLPPAWETVYYRPQTYSGPLGSEVSLSAARDEYESFALVILPRRGDLEGVTVTAGDLVRVEGEGTLDAGLVQVAPLSYVGYGSDRPYAEVLRPDIPSFDVPADAQQAAWVTVYVPTGTPAGVYRGALTVSARNAQSREVALELRVWDFTLPRPRSVFGVCSFNAPRQNDELELAYVRMAVEHNFDTLRLYEYPRPRSMEVLRQWIDAGARMVNLMWVSPNARVWRYDADGRIVALGYYRETDMRASYLDRLRPTIEALREEGLLDRVFVYGFDEPPPGWVPAMEDILGAVKEIDPGVATLFPTYTPTWDHHGPVRNVDYYMVTSSWLTPELISRLRQSSPYVGFYNLQGYTGTPGDASLTRSQFWSAFKSGLDGCLQYRLTEGGVRETGFPVDTEDAHWGLIRHHGDQGPLATIRLAAYRDGIDDWEYLLVLREAVEGAEASPAAEDLRWTLHEAKELLRVPDNIARPIHRMAPPADPAELLQARERIAELIEELGQAHP